MGYRALTDTEWAEIEWLLPEQKRLGRNRQHDREVFNAIQYVLITGCRWEELPATFPPKSTVHRRFHEWQQDGFFKRLVRYFRHLLPESDTFYIDGGRPKPAKKGGSGYFRAWGKRH